MKPKTYGQEEAGRTRQALLRRARQLFAEKGYAGTSIDEIAQLEQLTKGALYYHFKDKRDLFAAVMDGLLKEMTDRVAAAVDAETDPWERVNAAIDMYLEGCLDRVYLRIVVQEAPAALGWAAWREKEQSSVLGLSSLLLSELMDAGHIERQPVELLAAMVFGAVTEAGFAIAAADDPHAARSQARVTLARMVRGL